jgi:hypothetical protein
MAGLKIKNKSKKNKGTKKRNGNITRDIETLRV